MNSKESPTSSASNRQGAWIFVSHSHRDLEKVREIRDYLERRGGNPLLFFLKCLNDEDPRLPELISDEIKARDWFVLCDSPNARASKYVPKEVALVQSEKLPETIVTIDLTQGLEPQFHKLDRLIKRSTVFLSYTRSYRAIAERIRQELEAHDFSVWLDADSIGLGEDWQSSIQRAIDDAVARVFVLVLDSFQGAKNNIIINAL